MVSRRLVFVTSIVATAISSFTLGVLQTRRAEGSAQTSYDAQLAALRTEVRTELGRSHAADAVPAGTIGRVPSAKEVQVDPSPSMQARAKMVAEIKQELQSEMGLLPVHLLRDRRSSFVELYSTDSLGKTNYGTAGYLGKGYFITVKHAVVALKDEEDRQLARKITSIKIVYRGKEIPARVVDTGDADVEVHSGDWAIIKTGREVDLPSLHVDTSFSYDFAEPIFRLGNDYSKGIILSTGYVGQRTPNGLITCLTDGHPGVSGGGVLNQKGDLVGIPIGRMQGDYRFSFILPIRSEMLRKLPSYEPPAPPSIVAAESQ
jgi:S1-C subfamily serine protease